MSFSSSFPQIFKSCPFPLSSRRPALIALIAATCLFVLSALVWPRPAQAWGLQSGDAPDIQHDGRMGLVFPAADALPNPSLTPGALNPAVTQANIDETICRRGGYTRSIRPDESYTERLKREQIRQYGYPQQMGKDAYMLRNYEEDHLISLELGGSPDSPQNLWPEPHHVIGGWGSYVKDQLENRLHSLVCHHQITLVQAQDAIAHNWIASYQRLISPTPVQKRSHQYGG